MSFSGSLAGKGHPVRQQEEDRRREHRFLCGGKAEVRSLVSGLCARGRIANLSLGGCRMQLGEGHCFRKDDEVEMTFCVRQMPLRVQGVVRQANPGQALGIAFTLLTERGKRQLRELILELASLRRVQIESLGDAQH